MKYFGLDDPNRAQERSVTRTPQEVDISAALKLNMR
jgi:hypothetical protein